jgi:hypothetical protein
VVNGKYFSQSGTAFPQASVPRKPPLERDVTGEVRFFDGNLRATYDFAKKVTQIVRQST